MVMTKDLPVDRNMSIADKLLFILPFPGELVTIGNP